MRPRNTTFRGITLEIRDKLVIRGNNTPIVLLLLTFSVNLNSWPRDRFPEISRRASMQDRIPLT